METEERDVNRVERQQKKKEWRKEQKEWKQSKKDVNKVKIVSYSTLPDNFYSASTTRASILAVCAARFNLSTKNSPKLR